jgi:hypothetical protein
MARLYRPTRFGETPNVAVQMFTANYSDWSQSTNLFVWGTNYADLTNVAYHSQFQGARFIFTAASEYYVRLHSFQMGG